LGGGGFLPKLGRRSGRAGSGTHAVVPLVVAFASSSSEVVEVDPFPVVSQSLLALGVMVHWDGREPDGREGTGGMRVVGGFLRICLVEFRLLIELEGVEVGTPGVGLPLQPTTRGTPLFARVLDWDEVSIREEGRGFDEFGMGELVPNCPPPEGPVRKCVLDGSTALDLLLRWWSADGEAPMEGIGLLRPARVEGSDVVGGVVATDRTTSRGSLISRAPIGGCGLCFLVERNHGSVVLGPKRMVTISDMVENR